jgi:hypothetical protein
MEKIMKKKLAHAILPIGHMAANAVENNMCANCH